MRDILKALGARRRQIGNITARTAALLGPAGAIAGTILGVAVAYLLARYFAERIVDVSPGFGVSVPVIVVSLVAGPLLAVAASLAAMRRALRRSVAETLAGAGTDAGYGVGWLDRAAVAGSGLEQMSEEELGEGLVQVVGHGPRGQEQLGADLLVRRAAGGQPHDLQFLRRQGRQTFVLGAVTFASGLAGSKPAGRSAFRPEHRADVRVIVIGPARSCNRAAPAALARRAANMRNTNARVTSSPGRSRRETLT